MLQQAQTRDDIAVVVVDDQPLLRRGLAGVLETAEGITLVGEGSHAQAAVDLVDRARPDVLVLDVLLPPVASLSPFAACRLVRERHPGTQVLVLTSSRSESHLYAAVRAGASGYLLKNAPVEAVVDGIRAVHRGHSLVEPSVAARLFDQMAAGEGHLSGDGRLLRAGLTDREVEVLQLLATGLPNRAIADRLFIAENTVKNHVRRILTKLGLSSRVAAATYAVREGLTESREAEQ